MLEVAGLRFAPVAPNDVDELHAFFTSPEVRRFLLDDEAVERAVVAEWVQASIARFASGELGLWCARDGAVVAVVGFHPFHGQLELIYALAPSHWRRGLASQAATAAIAHAFAETEMATVHASTDAPNVASVRVLERLGMHLERTSRGEHPHPQLHYALSRERWSLLQKPVTLGVRSEIGTLEAVVVHRPGDEVVRMTQHELDTLLFDDILSPAAAVAEHALMTEILAASGARVFHLEDLLTLALARAPEVARRALLREICDRAGAPELTESLAAMTAHELTHALIAGCGWPPAAGISLARLRRQERGDRWALPPQPNLMFMRDPCVTIGDRILMGRMATTARGREPQLVAFALQHSGVCTAAPLLFDGPARGSERIEGGDVLVVDRSFLLVGCSERTAAATIERVAREAIFEAFDHERVYVVLMPEERSVMHLDTILTQIDRQLFLGHAPYITPSPQALRIAKLERGKPAELLPRATVVDVLRDELGSDTVVVPCGGDDPLHQEREQWTDGANALALAPGRIFLYARNVHTIAALAEHGFAEVTLHSAQAEAERRELIATGMARARTVFSFSGSELSRARGGGRCLTMPLRRASLG